MSLADFVTSLKGKKTVIFNIAIALAGVLYGQHAVDAITSLGVSSDHAIDAILVAYASANLALRAVSDGPIFGRQTPTPPSATPQA